MAYEREWKARNKERHRKQQLESQRRRLADPAKRAHYNALQRSYSHKGYKNRWAKNGFSTQLIARLLEAQGFACAVCWRDLRKHRYHADHDHESGKPRGLLCFDCNISEGKILALGLSPLEFGQRLHDYLLNPPARALS